MFDVPEAENSQLCTDGGDSMFGNENETDAPLVRKHPAHHCPIIMPVLT